MKNKTLWIGIVVIAIFGFIVIGVFKKHQIIEQDNIIRIGAVFILTGSGSELGNEGIQSLEIAKILTEDLYAEKGLKVQFYIEDSKSTPQGAINAYNTLKLKASKFDYVISHGSFAGGVLSELTKKDGKILLSTGANADPIKNNPFFVVNANDEAVIAQKFKEAINDESFNNVFVFFQDDDFGQSVLSALKNIGGDFPSCPFTSASDIKSLVLKSLKEISKNTSVIIVGYGVNTVNIIKNLRQNGFSGKIYGSSEMRTDENIAMLKSYSDNLYIMQYFMPSDKIIKLYEKNFGRKNLSVADIQTLNAILLALNSYVLCIESGNLKPEREYLMETLFSKNNMSIAPCVLDMHNQRIFYKMEFKEIE